VRASIIRLYCFFIVAIPVAYSGALPAADSAEDVKALNRQAVELYRQGKYAEAFKRAEMALAIAEKSLGPEDPDTLLSVNNLGFLYEAQGRYAEAEPLLRRALAGREKALGPDHADTLLSVNNLGFLYQAQGRYAEAEPLYRRALAGYDKALGPDHPDTLRSANNLASLYDTQGRYAEAEPLFRRALAGREKALGPEHPDTLVSVNNLGLLYRAQGRWAEAEPLLRRALAGYEKTLGPDHPGTLQIVSNLAALYQAQGRYADAGPLLRRALAGREKALGPEHPGTLQSVNNLAALYQAQGRYAEAEPLHRRALAGYQNALGPDHPDTLGSVNNLGFLYQAQGRYAEAEPLLRRAVAGRDKALGPDHPDTLISVNNLAALYQAQGRYAEAEPLHRRVLAGREKVLGPDHPDTLGTLNNLAALYFFQQDWLRAAQFWRRSTAGIAARTRRDALDAGQAVTGRKTSEAEQSSWQFRDLVKAVHRLAPEGGAQDRAAIGEMLQTAQWAVGSEAARSLAQMAARGASGDGALGGLVRERQDLVAEWRKRDTQRNAWLGQPAEKRNAKAETENASRLDAIDARIATIDKELLVRFPDYAALASPAPLTLEEVQAGLRPEEALILFLDTREWKPAPEETFIWVVTKADVRWVRSGLGTLALAREVAALRCGLDAAAWEGPRCKKLTGAEGIEPLPFDHARAHALYKALFGQIEDLIKFKQHLLLVPSGPLTQLPFQVLLTAPPSSADHRSAAWLIRTHALSVLPAVSSLKALRATARPTAAKKPLIGFGNPLLDGPNASYADNAKLAREKQSCPPTLWQRVASLNRHFAPAGTIDRRGGLANVSVIRMQPPLPETADELCEVARDLNADANEIRLGAHATEAEIKRLSASGALANYRIVHFATHGALAGQLDPGAEPGLLLTPPEAASEDDDGYLTASEIAALKLDADWVILSACNTAGADAQSAEAMSGLARAFFYAQARALLVSHWAVASDSTVKLITRAVSETASGERAGRAEALRRSMLALIEKGEDYEAHPTYWAPFVVVGEGGATR
jgi:CHAT domain-containing protein/tetratricopeptide (TPR) repeat protein